MSVDDSSVAVRAHGWRTLAALSPDDDASALGCSHRLADGKIQPL